LKAWQSQAAMIQSIVDDVEALRTPTDGILVNPQVAEPTRSFL
jgi:hypothetical protein